MHKPGTILLASWLIKQGISYDLQKRYRKSSWIESIGYGAFKRFGDNEVTWQGGLYAIQQQSSIEAHAGALTALSIQGLSHYLRHENNKVFIFSELRKKIPTWFVNHDWKTPIDIIPTSFLPKEIGLTNYEGKTFNLKISAPERAILECLYLAPAKFDLVECYQIMEGLTNLRPALVKELLIKCTSVKTKRLFIYMAEKAKHAWLKYIEIDKIDIGKGQRSLAKGGVYIQKYRLIVPNELANI